MQDLEKIVFYMKDEINKQADAECEAIMNEVNRLTALEKDKICEEAKKEAELHLNAAVRKLNSEKALAISKFSSEKTKALIEQRENYTNELFDEVKEKLVSYTNSHDYLEFMKKKIETYSFEDRVTVYVRKEDLKLTDLFKKQFECDVCEDNIEIGGFRIETSSQKIIDETLDTKLKDQRNWFADHSMMII